MSPFILLLLQDPTGSTAPQTPPAVDFRTAPVVAETHRIALTPRLDGKIEDEEWDALGTSGDVKTYLQWEPGTLHVAASMATGRDVLVSLDPDGDGWLVGRNNLEARIGVREGKPFVALRLLDATNVAGPTYREIPGIESASRVAVGADGTIEASIVDPGLDLLPKTTGKVSLRVDVLPTDAPPLAANEPRALTSVDWVDFRTAALPSGLKAKADFNDIAAVPGEDLRVRFGFSGEPMPKRIALRSEGLSHDSTTAAELPFPTAGKKGTNVEYRSTIASDALPGYRIARATLTGADGVPAVLQASYRIALPADVALKSTRLPASDKDRSLRLGFVVTGNSRRRLGGTIGLSVPSPFRIMNGSDQQRVRLAEPRLPLPLGADFFVPANSHGTVPITFALEIDKRKFEVVRYVTID